MPVKGFSVGIGGDASQFISATSRVINRLDEVDKAGKRSGTAIAGHFQTAAGGVNHLVSAVAKYGSVIAGLGSIGGGIGIAAGIKSASDQLDKQGKQSDVIGTTSEKLADIYYAGDLAGASVEGINTALVKLQKNTPDIAKRFGFGQGFAGADAVDKLFAVANQINRIPDQAGRIQEYMKAIGKGAAELIPLLQAGPKAFREAAQEAKALGLEISRADIAMVELGNDAVSRIKAAGTGALRQGAVLLAPFIAKAATDVVDYVKAGGGVTALLQQGIDAVKPAAAWVLDTVGRDIPVAFQQAKAAAADFAYEMVTVWREIAQGPMGAKLGLTDDGSLGKVQAHLREISLSATATADAMAKTKAPSAQVADWGKGVVDWAKQASQTAPAYRRMPPLDTSMLDALEDQTKRADEIRKASETPLDKYKGQMKELRQLLAAGLLTPIEAQRASAGYYDALLKASDATDKVKDSSRAAGDAVKDLGRAMDTGQAGVGEVGRVALGGVGGAVGRWLRGTGGGGGASSYNPNVTRDYMGPWSGANAASLGSGGASGFYGPAQRSLYGPAQDTMFGPPAESLFAGYEPEGRHPYGGMPTAQGISALEAQKRDPEYISEMRRQTQILANIERELTYHGGLG